MKPATPATTPAPLRLVALFVFLSGAASLGLEMAWSRMLKLVFGSTTLAVTTILVAYMLGLGLGGLLGGRIAHRVRNGVRAYGWLELAVGLYALLVPWALDAAPALHRAVAELGFWPAALVRFAVVLGLLLLPTLAMGATLPLLIQALTRSASASGSGLADRVGLLYGTNTLGAVTGVLGATFLGFRALGLHGTNTTAALLDVVVGALAIWWLAPRVATPDPQAIGADRTVPSHAARDGATSQGWLPVATYGLVGCTALAYEVAWTRGLAMILGSSTYAFATILAGFLAGIALGSLLARRHLDRLRDPRRAYGLGLLALGLTALAVALSFGALPELFLQAFASVGIAGTNLVWLGLGVAFLVMLAPTLVLGALFPLVVRLADEGRDAPGSAVGRVYFANTIGSALGAFLAGFVAIPNLGLPRVLGLAIALNFVAAAIVLATRSKQTREGEAGGSVRSGRPIAALALFGAFAVLLRPPAWDAEALASGVYYRTSVQLDFGLPKEPLAGQPAEDELLFYEEGVNCTVSVHRMADGLVEGGVSMRVNGKTDASLADMSTQVLSGHLPFTIAGAKNNGATLVIGYASGITAGAARLHTARVDVCEIEPAILAASRFFDDYNHRPLEQEGVRLIVDDGRSYLAATDARYDVIVSEPSNPWIAGCANLFTSEFFAVAKRALAKDGCLLQWIQLYGLDPDGLRSVLAALHEHFGYAYGFLFDASSNDLLLIATDTPLTPERLRTFDDLAPQVQDDLRRVRIGSTAELWSLARIGPEELRALADEAPVVNTDDAMLVELNAPWTLYDETEETLELVRARGGGLRSFFAPDTPDSPGARDTLATVLADDEALHVELALAYLLQRAELELAIDLRATLADESPLAGLFDALLAIEEGSGDGRQILAQVRSAAERRPGDFAPAYHLGRLLGEAGAYANAVAELERALSLRPGDLAARHRRAKVLAAMQRGREAYQELDGLLASPLIETEPRLWAEAAVLSGGFGRFEEALERMRRYLVLEPDSPDEWELAALWSERLGLQTEARDARANVAIAERRQVRELHWIARWHERFGTRREARWALGEVLRRDPTNRAAAEDLQRLGGPLPE